MNSREELTVVTRTRFVTAACAPPAASSAAASYHHARRDFMAGYRASLRRGRLVG